MLVKVASTYMTLEAALVFLNILYPKILYAVKTSTIKVIQKEQDVVYDIKTFFLEFSI